MSTEKEIFFHVGLGKTGTTFLQYKAFPFMRGIEYIQRTKYHQAADIIRTSDQQRFFLSYECDQQFWDVVDDWSAKYPQTRPIIMFRRQDKWIASQFRRFLKNCHVRNFKELFDLENDQGLFKKKDLGFYPMIEYLEQKFERPPIVFLYEDLNTKPEVFIEHFAHSIGTHIGMDAINLERKHTSYSEKQLKVLKHTQKYINLKKRVVFKNKVLEFFRKWTVNAPRYLILYAAKLIPSDMISSQPLIEKKELEKVRKYFEEDWSKVVDRANRP